MRRVVIESPYAGDLETNVRYLQAAMRDCLLRGEAPFASHAMYTQHGVLDDTKPDEREHGIQAGFAWSSSAEATIVYDDLGITKGMQYGIDHAAKEGRPIETRSLVHLSVKASGYTEALTILGSLEYGNMYAPGLTSSFMRHLFMKWAITSDRRRTIRAAVGIST